MVCLRMDFLLFILLKNCRAFWIWGLISFIFAEKSSVMIPSDSDCPTMSCPLCVDLGWNTSETGSHCPQPLAALFYTHPAPLCAAFWVLLIYFPVYQYSVLSQRIKPFHWALIFDTLLFITGSSIWFFLKSTTLFCIAFYLQQIFQACLFKNSPIM